VERQPPLLLPAVCSSHHFLTYTRTNITMVRALYNVVSFVLLFSFVAVSAVQDADSDQYEFLTELYQLTSGEMWANNTNWLVHNDNVTLCNWYGITCSGKWVQEIDLSSNGLGGPLPDKWERIPYLDDLDLSNNK
jgi:hypothetical protein